MRLSVWACVLGLTLISRAAFAGDPGTPALPTDQRERAMQLADEGLTLFDRGDFAGAQDRFEKAEAIVAIPPFTYQRGRALERLGRWTEALGCYERAAAMPLAPLAPAQHQAAKRDAQRAREALYGKVPRLTVRIIGDIPADVFVDGIQKGPAGPAPLLVDPGDHAIEARGREGQSARRDVKLAPSDAMTVDLKLGPPTNPGGRSASRGPSVLEIVGWVGVGVGSASLIVATATGIPAIIAKGDLVAACPEGRCPPSKQDDVDRYDGLRWAAGGTLIAGLALGAAGTACILFDPERKLFGGLVEPQVGPFFAGVTVRLP